ncbi:unnamed protein product [Enterobius vermicularis]|uniref:Wu: n=1 Tax=Enterobius vermicularis TaxID=51028 RepID=A0A0N4V5Q1_ENTVE|nr:unnamed protein product [Enterobius vermicularis]
MVIDKKFLMQCTEQPCGSLVKKLIGCRLPSGIWIPWNTSKNFGAARVSQNVWTNDDFGQHGRDLPPYCYTADYSTIPLNSQMLINGENVRCKHLGGLKVVLFRNNLRMCVDSLGFSHSIGSHWTSGGRFNKTCTPAGVIAYENCLTVDGRQIPMNATVTVGRVTYLSVIHNPFNVEIAFPILGKIRQKIYQLICTLRDDGVGYLEEKVALECEDDYGNDLHTGSHWIEGQHFNITCKDSGIFEVLNCITPFGLQLPIDGEVTINDTYYSCKQDKSRNVQYYSRFSGILPVETDIKCYDSLGTEHSPGTYWLEGKNVNKTCSFSGEVRVENCLTDEGVQVAADGTVSGGVVKCLRLDDCHMKIVRLPDLSSTANTVSTLENV